MERIQDQRQIAPNQDDETLKGSPLPRMVLDPRISIERAYEGIGGVVGIKIDQCRWTRIDGALIGGYWNGEPLTHAHVNGLVAELEAIEPTPTHIIFEYKHLEGPFNHATTHLQVESFAYEVALKLISQDSKLSKDRDPIGLRRINLPDVGAEQQIMDKRIEELGAVFIRPTIAPVSRWLRHWTHQLNEGRHAEGFPKLEDFM